MDNRRMMKIARLIQKELGEIFRLRTQSMRGVLVSVSDVRVTPDLSVAKVYLSIFPSEHSDELMKEIQASAMQIRFELGSRTGSQLRVIPELQFLIDETLDKMERIDELLAQDKSHRSDAE